MTCRAAERGQHAVDPEDQGDVVRHRIWTDQDDRVVREAAAQILDVLRGLSEAPGEGSAPGADPP